MRSDHPSNTKCGGVCNYYKEALPLRVINVSFNSTDLPVKHKKNLIRPILKEMS